MLVLETDRLALRHLTLGRPRRPERRSSPTPR